VDGADPEAALIDLNGTLYGTTAGGGSGGGSGCFSDGCGTIFDVTTSGAEHVLYSFQGGTDGDAPYAGLTNVKGTLYGITSFGGANGCYYNLGCGTIFKVSTSGSEKVIYSFQGGTDGSNPEAGLLNVNGTLYGTTRVGGTGPCRYIVGSVSGCGTIFAVSPSGAEQVLYSFQSGADGAGPFAGLINVSGTLYGTTAGGGASGDGTVFKVSTSGVEHVLYAFKGGPDGYSPFTALINVKGTLYGTTEVGGGSGGFGTVFDVSTSGAERVLYSFKSGTDGADPYAALTDVKGRLYGTTSEGGGSGCRASTYGCGTIFEVSTSGTEHVLYRFKGGKDGAYPAASLLAVGGALYGTAASGGRGASGGNGTIFKAVP
jgi:uncharacterized repeat protein (TIGR03803 family)